MDAIQLSRKVLEPYAALILIETNRQAASALTISSRYGIPIAACYRRIRELQEVGLLYCEEKVAARNGTTVQKFRSRLRSVRVFAEDGTIRTRIEMEGSSHGPEEDATVLEQAVVAPPNPPPG